MDSWFSFKRWSVRQYGTPLYRIPVDPGWGCPHRRPGETGRGCSFCSVTSGRARQLGEDPLEVITQVERAIEFSRQRYGEGVLQLYVQAYTATFASVEALRRLVEPLLESHDFVSLSVGTRPDCLPPSHVKLLADWNQSVDVWIELGIQSCHNATLINLNRQHSWEDAVKAVGRLRERELHVCPHLLFGLPGETSDEMFETLDQVVNLQVDALKLHNLHVLRDSPLGFRWSQQPFSVLDETAWLELVMQLLRRIPPDLPVFRLFTDSPPEERLAPSTQFSKGEFLTELSRRMTERSWCQGDLWRPNAKEAIRVDSRSHL